MPNPTPNPRFHQLLSPPQHTTPPQTLYFKAINPQPCLAVANRYGPNGHRENSTIFRWQRDDPSGTSVFVPFQNVATKGAYDFEYFEVHNTSFLAVANHWDERAPDPQHPIDIDSVVYWWDGSSFQPYQPIPTTGAEQVRHIRLVANGTTNHLLAIAQCVDGGTGDLGALSQILALRQL